MIDRDEIRRIAALARLDLSSEETDRFARQMDDILGYVKQLEELDVEHVEPAMYAVELDNALRPDEPGSSLTLEDVLRNNPGDDPGYFRVPKIIDDGAAGEEG